MINLLSLGDIPGAVLNAAVVGNIKKVRKLLSRGACPPDSPELVRALHSACANGNVELATLLIEYGVDVNAEDERGVSALGCAIEELNLDIIRLLIHKRASVNRRDDKGHTPLHQAIDSEVQWDMYPGDGIRKKPTAEIVALLIESGANVNAKTDRGETPLQLAIGLGHKSAQEVLLSHGAI